MANAADHPLVRQKRGLGIDFAIPGFPLAPE
jgi:hypothetical protein